MLGKTPANHLLVEIQLTHQSATNYFLCTNRNTIFTLNELTGLEKLEDINGTNHINLAEGSFYLERVPNRINYTCTPVKTFSTFMDLRRELNALMIEERL